MPGLRLPGVFLTFLFSVATSTASNYYVDCSGGNDAADGLSPATAWNSLRVVAGHVFHPGDSINFRRGSVCAGMLWPKGSGSAAAPIRIDAWGDGALPRVEAEAGQEAAFRLSDQEYWTIEHLEFSGGQPHGVFIDGTRGVLHGIHISDVSVHEVAGEPRNKESGLLVIAARNARYDDVVIDGIRAWRTSQWAGILVGSVAFVPESARSTNVVVRNSVVHDVGGDGIVLFQVNNGLIENSVAWHTGMQQKETIGTPNAIWTWMCRDCTVRRNEAFLTRSPGIDGGAFDIDYGDDNNVVEDNYGHDTQGYCVAVFAAGTATSNSTVRNNVCANNGGSARLAKSQGAIFLSTWNGGTLKGLRISGNRIFWNPPADAAALLNIADFTGSGTFEDNTIQSVSPFFVISNASLLLDRNSWEYSGPGLTQWQYGGKSWAGFTKYQQGSGQDAHSHEVRARSVSRRKVTSGWRLRVSVSRSADDPDSRGQIALLEGVRQQFPSLTIDIAAAGLRGPSLVLLDPSGRTAWRHDGLTAPGDLGLALRSFFEAEP